MTTAMTTDEAHKNTGMGKDLVVYLCILALAAIQFVIAYQDISASQMFGRMLSVAVVEAGLALLFFMHLSENRGLMWFVLIFTVSVVLGMQYGWTDSFRILGGVPWAK
jgi:heme/copper-type cytochrome/quinol oxidase subunit 4